MAGPPAGLGVRPRRTDPSIAAGRRPESRLSHRGSLVLGSRGLLHLRGWAEAGGSLWALAAGVFCIRRAGWYNSADLGLRPLRRARTRKRKAPRHPRFTHPMLSQEATAMTRPTTARRARGIGPVFRCLPCWRPACPCRRRPGRPATSRASGPSSTARPWTAGTATPSSGGSRTARSPGRPPRRTPPRATRFSSGARASRATSSCAWSTA